MRGFSLIEVIAALAILSVALVSVMQLFSFSLGTTRNNEDVTISVLQARSLLEEACAPGPSPEDFADNFTLAGGAEAVREVVSLSDEEDGPELFRVTVSVSRPTGGVTRLTCTRAYHEAEQ